MAIERRRSDRLLLTVPLRVERAGPTGADFSEDARTVSVNRHGARIQISCLLKVGQVLRLANQLSRSKGEFRVVGPVAAPTSLGGEWGIECLDPRDNIWGIKFPPAQNEGPGSRALLECRKCHTVAVQPVSLVEVDVLDTAGIISKDCQTCSVTSPWGYAEKQVTMGAPPGEAAMIEEAQSQIEGSMRRKVDRRRHRRVCLQLPVLIRDYYGGVEITKSENVSKGGFCFAAEKNYYMGQGLMAVCPYNSSSSQNIEVRARIVRRREWEGLQRKLYGVRYLPKT